MNKRSKGLIALVCGLALSTTVVMAEVRKGTKTVYIQPVEEVVRTTKVAYNFTHNELAVLRDILYDMTLPFYMYTDVCLLGPERARLLSEINRIERSILNNRSVDAEYIDRQMQLSLDRQANDPIIIKTKQHIARIQEYPAQGFRECTSYVKDNTNQAIDQLDRIRQ